MLAASNFGVLGASAALVIVASMSSPEHLWAQDTDAWKQRFLKEAPQAWDSYGKRAKRFQGSSTWVQVRPEKHVMVNRRHEFKQGDGCAMFLQQTLVSSDNDKSGWLRVVNPRYGFELHRRTPTGAWAVSQVDSDLSDGVSFRSPVEEVERWSTWPFIFTLISPQLRVISKDSGFVLKTVIPVVREGNQCAKVEFDYRSPGTDPRVPSIVGWVVHDPARYWVIREYDVQVEWGATATKGTMVATYEYKYGEDGFPILKRCVQRSRIPSRSYESEHTFEFDLREASIPESEFTLAAFGFPEPAGAKVPTPWYLWVAIGALACLGLGVLFRWLARRATRRAQA